jgi:hypothetical protein
MHKSPQTKKQTSGTRKKGLMVKSSRDRAFQGDWADAVEASRSATVVQPLRPTSIKLEPELITLLTQKGRKRGLPYQTMLKVILKENIDRY